ncbi:alpha-amylase family glycosyl hydrolase [Amycolatopsis cynarae]|uniref:Alpha-amylase n=1 Tax=Amycolatopsis cynarae TaxID=2995223 RepID=A0ABY7AYB0_9PSEU|nr:carbohydrate-binding module family 20 domain-containing protein [Amycolatopsis sp. HUAS 11-8]WAL64995.1 alpha-amylase family glycosyl hydrolase [Amycolatopsis sp. HUAS 11-8]
MKSLKAARRALSVTAVAALVSGAVVASISSVPMAQATPPGNPVKDVIANLFEWNWNSVARECANVLGPAGYGAVQVAPPEESISLPDYNGVTHPWWEVYQPVSYGLNSRMGTRDQFAAMVTACHHAGIKVYADAVLNHMTGHTGGVGYAGTAFSGKYSYGGLYSSGDFHYYPANCPNSTDQITDWNNQTEVQECELVDLADLYTEQSGVRAKEAAYLNDMIGLGVDGFRMDAAKSINDNDIAAIESQLNRTTSGTAPYVYQEVMPGGAVTPSMYTSTGDVLEFTYASDLKNNFQGSIANLSSFGSSWGLQPSANSVTFVDNHDTDRNGSTLSYQNGRTYLLANVFHLAWGYGTPQVYASFQFSSSDQSPPANGDGTVTDTDCATSAWYCTDRNQAVTGMVGWHNAVAGTTVANWWSDGSNSIAFSRGGKGFVAINNEGSTGTRTYVTGLPAGKYCDVIHGTYSSSSGCSGPVITVDGSGNATIPVPAYDAVAIDVDAPGTCSNCATVTFDETESTSPGQYVFVVGSLPQLGNWSPASSVALSSAGYPVWSASVDLPANTTFQYKYLVKNSDGTVTWESDPNRSYTTPAGGTATLGDTWR